MADLAGSIERSSMTQLAYPNLNDSTIFAVNEQLPSVVAAIGRIHFEGNVIPHEWYQKITLHDGKPDLPAIIILAEIVYWYRPIRLLDSQGKPLIQKKFNEDMFQSGASYYEDKFGLTKNQVRKALKRLEEAGFIRREYREVVKRGIRLNNVMFIEPVPSKILEITHPPQHKMVVLANENVLSLPTGEGVSPVGERV
ncbi:MAG TPA: hypothetical protein VJ508_07800, partial [Saprospiraceae bacterium]|nr:hypothetical protein [Saprospiraceae bacterium]